MSRLYSQFEKAQVDPIIVTVENTAETTPEKPEDSDTPEQPASGETPNDSDKDQHQETLLFLQQEMEQALNQRQTTHMDCRRACRRLASSFYH